MNTQKLNFTLKIIAAFLLLTLISFCSFGQNVGTQTGEYIPKSTTGTVRYKAINSNNNGKAGFIGKVVNDSVMLLTTKDTAYLKANSPFILNAPLIKISGAIATSTSLSRTLRIDTNNIVYADSNTCCDGDPNRILFYNNLGDVSTSNNLVYYDTAFLVQTTIDGITSSFYTDNVDVAGFGKKDSLGNNIATVFVTNDSLVVFHVGNKYFGFPKDTGSVGQSLSVISNDGSSINMLGWVNSATSGTPNEVSYYNGSGNLSSDSLFKRTISDFYVQSNNSDQSRYAYLILSNGDGISLQSTDTNSNISRFGASLTGIDVTLNNSDYNGQLVMTDTDANYFYQKDSVFRAELAYLTEKIILRYVDLSVNKENKIIIDTNGVKIESNGYGYSYTFPKSDGLEGQTLVNDGLGKISWQNLDSLLPYRKYVALLTQTDNLAPVATVLENTLGNIIWTRAGVGQYIGTLTGAFPDIKTFFYCTPHWDGGSNLIISVGSETSPNSIRMRVYDTDVEALTDDGLFNTSLEIKVYK